MDSVFGVVCWCFFRGLVISLRRSTVLEVTKDRGTRGTEKRPKCRDGGRYDTDVDLEAIARQAIFSIKP